jgi:ubiquinone biosynthesis protein COQ9
MAGQETENPSENSLGAETSKHSETQGFTEVFSADAAAIIRASLMHVPFDGWSDEALRAGAKDAGIAEGKLAVCFPNGPVDAISAYITMADDEMVARFEALADKPQKVHLMIRALILIRLQQEATNKEAVRRAFGVLALPANAAQSARTLYRTVDVMWRAAGQRDTDFSFYTKRATLAAVYSSTMLAWLADSGSDMVATEAFLDRRLKDVARIPQMTGPARSLIAVGQKLAKGLAGGMRR